MRHRITLSNGSWTYLWKIVWNLDPCSPSWFLRLFSFKNFEKSCFHPTFIPNSLLLSDYNPLFKGAVVWIMVEYLHIAHMKMFPYSKTIHLASWPTIVATANTALYTKISWSVMTSVFNFSNVYLYFFSKGQKVTYNRIFFICTQIWANIAIEVSFYMTLP